MSKDVDSALQTVTQGAGLVLFGTIIQLGIAFFAKAIMARFLALNQYGFVSLAIIAINFGATISLVGLDTGVARYLSRFETVEVRRRAVYFSYALTLLLSLMIGGALFLTAETVSTTVFQDERLAPILRVMAAGVPLWTLLDLGVGATRGLAETAPRIYAKNIALPLGRFLLVAVAIGLGYGAIGVASAYVGSYMIAAILMTYLVVRRLRPVSPQMREPEQELLGFSLPLTFSNLSSLLYRNVDIVLLGIISGAGSVAVYNVAYPLARLLLVGSGAFGFLLVPVVSSLHAEDQLDDAKRVYQVITKWLLLLITPGFAIMALFPEMALKLLFGAKYIEGALTLVVLAVAFFLTNVTGLSKNLLTSIGRSRAVMLTDVLSLGLNIVLNLLLIPQYGFLGAGIATAITYLGRDIANGILLYRWTSIHPFTASMLRPAFFAASAIVAIYVPVQLFFQASLVQLVGLFLLFLVIYGVAVLRFGGIDREDIMMVNSIEEYAGLDLTPLKTVIRRLMG